MPKSSPPPRHQTLIQIVARLSSRLSRYIISSFIDLTQDTQWGMPQVCYIDNGGEYSALDLAEGAMQLAAWSQGCDEVDFRPLGLDAEAQQAVQDARRDARAAIVRAQPYNAPAKQVEGLFSVLERGPLAMLQGWIGGNRMAKKTHNVGREPVAFEGGEEAFQAALGIALDYYHTQPQRGFLDGRTPNQAFAEAVAKGWKRTDVERDALLAAFARDVERQVHQGEIQFKNRFYRLDDLLTLLPGTKVILREPLVGDIERLAVLDENRRFLGFAECSPSYGVLDPEGARDAGRRKAKQARAIKSMRAEVEPVNLHREMEEAVRLTAPAPTPASGGIIRLAPEHQDQAAAARRQPKRSQRSIEDESHQKQRESGGLLERLAAG